MAEGEVDASQCPVDGVFAHVVCSRYGDVLAWQSGPTTRSPRGDRRTACPANRPDDCRRGETAQGLAFAIGEYVRDAQYEEG